MAGRGARLRPAGGRGPGPATGRAAGALRARRRPNPAAPHAPPTRSGARWSTDPRCVLSIVDDYAYIPGPWRAEGDTPTSSGVPTSHYASVQLSGEAEPVDDPAAKAALLQRQVERFQPAGETAEIAAHDGPFHRMLKGIRGVVLHVESVTAKFKYGDNKSVSLNLNRCRCRARSPAGWSKGPVPGPGHGRPTTPPHATARRNPDGAGNPQFRLKLRTRDVGHSWLRPVTGSLV
ncbi:FMN-binding negative transcriptional regulator [Saccharopolyspora pogona]|uniref:FMN-binding negative transcriptional regulator n=1 Tax=Saccharopolyspora pogona TaxID=333966 RepID=UPI001CC2529A|nr:FMN-binding negative transcriptional regulator [Saccharopolyspora pogona]